MKRFIIIFFLWGVCQVQTSVPNTTTFSLTDVTAVVGGTSLTQAFTNSIDANFDPAYKGSKNSLLNFRNYSGTIYYSEYVCVGNYQRETCPEGQVGEIGDVCLDAGAFTSTISVAAANDSAYMYIYGGYGQEYANDNFGCVDECPTGTPDVVILYSMVGGVGVSCESVCFIQSITAPSTSFNVYIDPVTNICYTVWGENCERLPDGCYILEEVDMTPIPIQVVNGVIEGYPC